jgi:RND superfamily putative drug exporter
VSISADGNTAVILGGTNADPNTIVRTADALRQPLRALSGNGVTVAATGASVLWSDFNTANRTAMLRSEMISWPVTLIILLLAFGSLVAAGLPFLLTLVGLLSGAGLLDLLHM